MGLSVSILHQQENGWFTRRYKISDHHNASIRLRDSITFCQSARGIVINCLRLLKIVNEKDLTAKENSHGSLNKDQQLLEDMGIDLDKKTIDTAKFTAYVKTNPQTFKELSNHLRGEDPKNLEQLAKVGLARIGNENDVLDVLDQKDAWLKLVPTGRRECLGKESDNKVTLFCELTTRMPVYNKLGRQIPAHYWQEEMPPNTDTLPLKVLLSRGVAFTTYSMCGLTYFSMGLIGSRQASQMPEITNPLYGPTYKVGFCEGLSDVLTTACYDFDLNNKLTFARFDHNLFVFPQPTGDPLSPGNLLIASPLVGLYKTKFAWKAIEIMSNNGSVIKGDFLKPENRLAAFQPFSWSVDGLIEEIQNGLWILAGQLSN